MVFLSIIATMVRLMTMHWLFVAMCIVCSTVSPVESKYDAYTCAYLRYNVLAGTQNKSLRCVNADDPRYSKGMELAQKVLSKHGPISKLGPMMGVLGQLREKGHYDFDVYFVLFVWPKGQDDQKEKMYCFVEFATDSLALISGPACYYEKYELEKESRHEVRKRRIPPRRKTTAERLNHGG